MNILEIGLQQGIEKGIERGIEQGIEQGIEKGIEQGIKKGMEQGIGRGRMETLVRNVEAAMKNFHVDLDRACEGLGTTVEEYERAKEQTAAWEKAD